MATYIDREQFIRDLTAMKIAYDTFGLASVISLDSMIKALKESELADVVEVVRCIDCAHYVFANGCPLRESGYFKGGKLLPLENDFCSYGERRPDNDKA